MIVLLLCYFNYTFCYLEYQVHFVLVQYKVLKHNHSEHKSTTTTYQSKEELNNESESIVLEYCLLYLCRSWLWAPRRKGIALMYVMAADLMNRNVLLKTVGESSSNVAEIITRAHLSLLSFLGPWPLHSYSWKDNTRTLLLTRRPRSIHSTL